MKRSFVKSTSNNLKQNEERKNYEKEKFKRHRRYFRYYQRFSLRMEKVWGSGGGGSTQNEKV